MGPPRDPRWTRDQVSGNWVALGEGEEHRAGDVVDLGDSPLDRAPLDAEGAGERVAQHRLVEVARPGGLRVERGGVQCRPAAVHAAGDVRDHHVGVQLRVPSPAGAVLEGIAR